MSKVLVGADPEVFMMKDGRFISAHGMIPGTKKAPFKVDKGAVQVDGMALEFNINPASSEDEFVVNINTVMNIMKKMVEGYEVHAVPVADFPLDYIHSQPDEAKELGCDPDFNGWTESANPKPNGEVPMRTASGHVHIGIDPTASRKNTDENMWECCDLAKQMDFFLGLPSIFYDDDTRRRSLYGKAGAFRPKPYGLEYRTLSNKWLSSEKLMRYVYKQVQRAVEAFRNGNRLYETYGDIQDIINNSDKKEANKIIYSAGI